MGWGGVGGRRVCAREGITVRWRFKGQADYDKLTGETALVPRLG